MPTQGLITTEELLHHRSVASKIVDSKKKWASNYAWFPVEQQKHYKQLDEIYLECRGNFGDPHFMEYARKNRLNSRFTGTAYQKCLEAQQRAQLQSPEHYKPSATTNGEYGRIPPSRLFYC